MFHMDRIEDPQHTRLLLRGVLDATTALELRRTLEGVLSTLGHRVTVDLSALRLIDSTGVGALVALYKRVGGGGGTMTFAGVTGQPMAVFHQLGLDRLFTY